MQVEKFLWNTDWLFDIPIYPPLKNNGKPPFLIRRYIFIHGCFSIAISVFQGVRVLLVVPCTFWRNPPDNPLARCASAGPTLTLGPPPWAQQSLEKMMSQMKRWPFGEGKEASIWVCSTDLSISSWGDIQKHSKATVPFFCLQFGCQKMLRCTVWGTIFQQRINNTSWLLVALSIFCSRSIHHNI